MDPLNGPLKRTLEGTPKPLNRYTPLYRTPVKEPLNPSSLIDPFNGPHERNP